MAKIKVPSVSEVKSWEDLRRFQDVLNQEVVSAINGRISFTENMDENVIQVTFASANTDTVLNHTLKRIPVGYLPVNQSVAMQIYTGAGTATTTNFYLRSTVAGTATVLLF